MLCSACLAAILAAVGRGGNKKKYEIERWLQCTTTTLGLSLFCFFFFVLSFLFFKVLIFSEYHKLRVIPLAGRRVSPPSASPLALPLPVQTPDHGVHSTPIGLCACVISVPACYRCLFLAFFLSLHFSLPPPLPLGRYLRYLFTETVDFFLARWRLVKKRVVLG